MADDSDMPPKQPSSTGESKLAPAPPSSAIEVPPEVLSQLPAQVQQHFGMFAATMGPARSGPDRLLERIPEGQAAEVVGRIVSHADKALELQHAERMAQIQARERQHVHVASTQNQQQGRALWFAVFVVVLGVLLAGYCLYTGKDQLAVTLLSSLLSGAGGYGVGRGVRSK